MGFMFKVPRASGIDLQRKLEEAREQAAQSRYHLEIEGDTERGVIAGVVQGSYRISDSAIVVSIRKKPSLASEAQIRKTVTEFFS